MKDGGSAFPRQPRIIHPRVGETVMEQGGMSLRDYFAAAALNAIIARSVNDQTAVMQRLNNGFSVDRAPYANTAYQYADAMLAEREKQP